MGDLICQWDKAKFLIFSDNVFDPFIYYSHLGPMALAIVIGLFIFFGNRKELSNKILLSLIMFFCIWSFFDLALWANEKKEYIMFFWSSLIFFDLLIYTASFYFVYVFIYGKDISFTRKIIIVSSFLPLILFSPTEYNLIYFDLTNCEREAAEGIIWSYTYFVEGLFVVWIIIEGIKGIIFSKTVSRRKILSVVLGVIFFLVAFSWGNIVGSITDDWSVGQYGLFGMPIFIFFLSYAVVKYHALNMRIISAQALVAALVVLVGSQLFFVKTTPNIILALVTLALVISFGYILIKSVRDEIERKAELQVMADRLAMANQRLKKLDQAKSEFISIASHQLRTPLTSIKGFISLILEGTYGKVAPEIQNALNKVYLSNERLIQLVEDLLNISRIESGRLQFKVEETDMRKLVEETAEMFILRARDKNLELKMHLPAEGEVPHIKIDAGKVREVVSNLIDNAIKYTNKGRVEVSLKKHINGIRIIIEDTGVGVQPEDMPYLFQKFSRGKDVSRMHATGTGLGLYVGKNLIEAQNGKIWVESEGLDRGSTFYIELPIENDKEPQNTFESMQ